MPPVRKIFGQLWERELEAWSCHGTVTEERLVSWVETGRAGTFGSVGRKAADSNGVTAI